MNHGLIPYIGGKHRLAKRLVEICAAQGKDLFVDCFGGSAAVMLAAGAPSLGGSAPFQKLVYNDIDGDLVNLFRTVADRTQRRHLFNLLRWLPPSRKIFTDDYLAYRRGGFSFAAIADPVERARKTLYRHLFCFGGKVRSGGFQASSNDPDRIKEVQRYRNVLRKLAKVGETFRGAIIENLHYSELLRIWGGRSNAVIFVDPPYDGTEGYYSQPFSPSDHVFLAQQLTTIKAAVVCTYYKTELIESLYPANLWTWQSIAATKNCCLSRGNKVITDEWVITRK